MLSALEMILIVAILGGLLIFVRRRALGLLPYLTIGILLLVLITAMRVIRFLAGLAIILALVCIVLLWTVTRRR